MNKLFQMLLIAMAITVAMPSMAQEDKAALKMQKAKEKAAKKEANKQKRQEKLLLKKQIKPNKEKNNGRQKDSGC